MQIDADGGQRGTLGSLLRATCATDAKLLPVINFLGEAMKLCSIHFKREAGMGWRVFASRVVRVCKQTWGLAVQR